MRPIDGKVALITGGGHGIGRAIACAFAAAGVTVVITGRNNEKLDETKAIITGQGGVAMAVTGDIADKASVKSVFARVQAEIGPIDILVNNAGITYSKKFQETPDEVWEQIIQTNVNGMFYCCKAAIPDMINKCWGRIITIASIAGLFGLPYSSAYSASKHAQLGLTRTLAMEVARYNIAVNAICPGWVETEMLAESIANIVKKTGRTPQEARADILKLSGQSRVITPEEVATEALRLASLEDVKETGQAITML